MFFANIFMVIGRPFSLRRYNGGSLGNNYSVI